MIAIPRPAFVAFVAFLTVGCQTASLEDAAPRAAFVSGAESTATPEGGLDQQSVASSDVFPEAPAAVASEKPQKPKVALKVPQESGAQVERQAFVTEGASRTGEYPTFGSLPATANTQLSAEQKSAAEAEFAELLRARARTPSARAQYNARLKQLRELGASHGNDTLQQIEN